MELPESGPLGTPKTTPLFADGSWTTLVQTAPDRVLAVTTRKKGAIGTSRAVARWITIGNDAPDGGSAEAGVDAGAPDASASDGGAPGSAPHDAGVFVDASAPDGGAAASPGAAGDGGGCGCATIGSSDDAWPLAALGFGVAATLARARRRRTRA
jgi:MYXO-CTERM domain-containing protein